MNYSYWNELQRYNRKQKEIVRRERTYNRMALVFFIGFIAYIVWGAL